MWIPRRLGAAALGGVVVLLTVSLSALESCGKSDRPPAHPSASMRERSATRVELVTLVIGDSSRAARVRSAYERIDRLGGELDKTRAAHAKKLVELSESRELPEADVRAELWKLRDGGKKAYPKYVNLQLQIRQDTTPSEFAKLDEIH